MRILLSCLALALLSSSSVAHADERIVLPSGATWAPLGTGIVTGDTTDDALTLTLRAAGESPQRIALAGKARDEFAAWAASPRLLAVQLTGRGGQGAGNLTSLELRAGELRTPPLTQVQRCGPGVQPSQFTSFPDPAVDGSTIAAVGGDCRDDRVLVRFDGANPSGRVIDAGSRVAGLDVAGRWLAVATEATFGTLQIGIWDLATGSLSYRLTLTSPALLARFFVQDDGTIAFSYGHPPGLPGDPGGCHTGWASPAQPTIHELTLGPCPAVFGLSAGRLLFTSGQRLPTGTLLLTDLHAIQPRAIARVAFLDGAHLDGERVFWGDRGCLGQRTVHIRAITDTSSPPPALRCEMRVGTAPLRMQRNGIVRVAIFCPYGCKDASIGMIRCAHRTCGRFIMALDLARGERRTLRLRLNRRACRLITRAPRRVLLKTSTSAANPISGERVIRLDPRSSRRGRACGATRA